MTEYHKIQTAFLRDPETKFKTLLDGQWAKPEFEYLKSCPWRATEKIDGTNVRIIWDGGRVRFGGKTDDAQLHASLVEHLCQTFTVDRMRSKFDGAACLYGEGFGAKIQKAGGRYSPVASFILFDVKVGDWWLEDTDILDVANALSIPMVPVVAVGTLHDCIEVARRGFKSIIAKDSGLDAEGLVMKPTTPLFNRKGDRVIAKIKARDFSSIQCEAVRRD